VLNIAIPYFEPKPWYSSPTSIATGRLFFAASLNAMSIASGLYAGGAKPIVLIQNTGLMESGDSIRGWLLGMEVPIVLMVGLRGWTRHGVTTDTAAVYTERFLNAFNINYYLVENDADAPRIDVAFKEAAKNKRPVAILVGDEYHGFGSK